MGRILFRFLFDFDFDFLIDFDLILVWFCTAQGLRPSSSLGSCLARLGGRQTGEMPVRLGGRQTGEMTV